jgi:RNA polymerase sigma-70 factor (ECF subfamily)
MQPFRKGISPHQSKESPLIQNNGQELGAAWDSLLAACRQGDRRAQRALYDGMKAKMFGVCLRYAESREEAEDMLQEGFVRVFKDLHSYRGEGNLEGWIRKVVVNTALQAIRRRHRFVPTEELNGKEEYGTDSLESAFAGEQTSDALVSLMQKLPAGFRTVLNLYIIEEYSHQEIADMLGISTGTSKSQLMRAKEAFRKLLEKHLVR